MRLGYRLVTVSANHEKSLYLLNTLDLMSLFCTIYLTCLKMYPSFSGAIWTVTESGLSILTKVSNDSSEPMDGCVLVLWWSKIACPVNVQFVISSAASPCKVTLPCTASPSSSLSSSFISSWGTGGSRCGISQIQGTSHISIRVLHHVVSTYQICKRLCC